MMRIGAFLGQVDRWSSFGSEGSDMGVLNQVECWEQGGFDGLLGSVGVSWLVRQIGKCMLPVKRGLSWRWGCAQGNEIVGAAIRWKQEEIAPCADNLRS